MIPPGRVGSRSTIEVIHGSERLHTVSARTQPARRVRVSSIPIIVVNSGGANSSTAAATKIRCTVAHAKSNSAPTSDIARLVVTTAAATLTRSRAVSRARAGSWSLTWVNDPREHSRSAQTNRRLRTDTRNATTPCGRSLTRHTGRSFTSDEATPHDGQPPSVATSSTRTRRAPSGPTLTSRTRNPGNANNNDVRSDMTRGLFCR